MHAPIYIAIHVASLSSVGLHKSNDTPPVSGLPIKASLEWVFL